MVLIFECGIIYIIDSEQRGDTQARYDPHPPSLQVLCQQRYRREHDHALTRGRCVSSLYTGNGTESGILGELLDSTGWRMTDTQSTWSMVLLAGIAVLLAPIPIVFYRLGSGLRARSRFSAEL